MSAIQWTTSSMHHIPCYDYMFWLTASVVIALYSKGGGKNGKHAGVPNVTNVASISYAGFQVFQRMHRQLFQPITSATIAFSTNQYHLLPSTSILCILPAVPQAGNNSIEIHSRSKGLQYIRGIFCETQGCYEVVCEAGDEQDCSGG